MPRIAGDLLTFVNLFDIFIFLGCDGMKLRSRNPGRFPLLIPLSLDPFFLFCANMSTGIYDDDAKEEDVENPMRGPGIQRRGTMLLNADGGLDTTVPTGTTQHHDDEDEGGGSESDDSGSYSDGDDFEQRRRRDPSDFAAEAKASRRLSVQEKGEKVRMGVMSGQRHMPKRIRSSLTTYYFCHTLLPPSSPRRPWVTYKICSEIMRQ